MPAAQHNSHSIRQGQKAAYRDWRLRDAPRFPGRGPGQIGRRAEYRPLTTIRQRHHDHRRATPRSMLSYRKATAKKRVVRIHDGRVSDSSINDCGIMDYSGIPRTPMRSWTAWSTTPTAWSSRGSPCAAKRPVGRPRAELWVK